MNANKTATGPKILLIHPQMRERGGHIWSHSGRSLPLGLAYIASVLEEDDFSVRIIDFQLPGTSLEKMKSLLEHDPPDMVGVSVCTPSAKSAFDIALGIKTIKDDLPVIFGGPHPTAIGARIFDDCPAVDISVLGEAESTAGSLFRTLYEKRDLSRIPGIIYRTDNSMVITQRPGPITDLDSLPFPARHHFPIKKYVPVAGSYRKTPCMSVISSRGCSYQCVFCNKNIHGNIFRARSAPNIIEEVGGLIEDYDAKEIAFFDDSFSEDKGRVLAFCEETHALSRRIIWRCSARVDRVDRSLLRAMHEAGCYRIGFGIESGSKKILNIINKEITPEKALTSIRLAQDAGIETIAYIMLNLPGETKETITETAHFIRKLSPDILLCQLAYPFPGTPLRRIVEEQYEVIHEKWNDFDGRFSNDVVFLQNGLTVRFLERSFKRIVRHFYLRPSYLLKSIIRLRDPSLWLPYFKIFLNIVRLRIND